MHITAKITIFAKSLRIMRELRYPIGIQTFSKIIEEGYAYVDKTSYIKPLQSQGQFIFLSRPRRFGKSLMLSTLEAYFEGQRELFKGLAADSMDLDWTPSPVLRFDFTAENSFPTARLKSDSTSSCFLSMLRIRRIPSVRSHSLSSRWISLKDEYKTSWSVWPCC